MNRVLAVHPAPDLYGADLMLVASLRAMADAGLDVRLVVPEDGPLLERLTVAGIPVTVQSFPVLRKALLKPLGLLGLGLRLPLELSRLRRLIQSAAPDVIYVNTLTLPHWILAGRLAGVPVVCHVHELEDQLPRSVNRVLTAPLLLATSLVANSVATLDYLALCWARLRPRTQVVYNGIDFPAATSRSVRRGRKRIALVGRLNPRKGQDVAIDAVKLLVDAGHDVHLELVGSAFRGYEWYPEQLTASAAAQGIGERVSFSGFQSSVWAAMHDADVVIVPSRIEPFGVVAVEALGTGAPVVVSRVGGLPEIVEDGRTGLVVEPDDAAALAGALGQLLNDSEMALAYGQAGSDDVRDRFTRDRYEREMVDAVCAVVPGMDRVIDLREPKADAVVIDLVALEDRETA